MRGQRLSLRNGPPPDRRSTRHGGHGRGRTGHRPSNSPRAPRGCHHDGRPDARARDGLPGHQPRDRRRRRPRRSEDRHPHHLRGNACVARAPHAGAGGLLGKRIDPTDPLEAIRQSHPRRGRRRSPPLTDRRRGRPAIDPDRRTYVPYPVEGRAVRPGRGPAEAELVVRRGRPGRRVWCSSCGRRPGCCGAWVSGG
ncbi:hypothetical protein FNV64_53095 [Streptomyces sp. S1A1-7]|nr:hypothetical protein FNV64_53095 [Streptomyces sp. S1A1-7]